MNTFRTYIYCDLTRPHPKRIQKVAKEGKSPYFRKIQVGEVLKYYYLARYIDIYIYIIYIFFFFFI